MPYYCHNCHHEINDDSLPDLNCPSCQSGFVEEVAGGPRRTSTRSTNQSFSSEVYDPFRDFQAETQWFEERSRERDGESSSGALSETHQLSNKRTLHDLFRPPIELVFRGSLTAARESGQQNNKWLLINIQNHSEFACIALNRDVWSNQTVKDILKEHFLFWQVYHDSMEGRRFMQFYNVKTFPHVSIVDPRTGEQVRSWPKTIDHNSFCDSVIEFLSINPSPDGSGEINISNKKPCVKDDGVKEEAKERVIKEKIQEKKVQDIVDDDETDEDVATETLPSTLYDQSEEAQLQAAIKASLPPENYKDYLGQSEKCSDLIIRFPDGSRDKCQFPSDSKLKALFLYLSSRGYDLDRHNYLTTFPRRNLTELPSMDSLADAKLIKETIYIERK